MDLGGTFIEKALGASCSGSYGKWVEKILRESIFVDAETEGEELTKSSRICSIRRL